MKIYFTGSHSVGKSTLSKYVAKKYELPMISETARMVLSEQELQIDSLRADLDATDSYQRDVFERQLFEEAKYPSGFVSDRSALDVLAYSAQHARILPELLKRIDLQEYAGNLQDAVIFFVRPSKATLKNDGVREHLTWDGVVQIDGMIKLLLEMFNITYFQIAADSMQERLRLIDAVLSLNNSNNY